MARYNSILPCLALFALPIGAYLVLSGASTLPDLALVLCMSFGAGAPLLRARPLMWLLRWRRCRRWCRWRGRALSHGSIIGLSPRGQVPAP